MTNKKSGNQFEAELCEILANDGYWVHNLAQNAAGQPADVIAVRDGEAFLIDCKVCSKGTFPFSRIEENQELAMSLWQDCGNGAGWFALKFDDEIYMVDAVAMREARGINAALTKNAAAVHGTTLDDWMWYRR